MNIFEFRDKIVAYIEENYSDVRVNKYDATKNNDIKLCGISIGSGNYNICPTIYLESFFETYKNGTSIEEIVEKIFEIEKDAKIYAPDTFDERFYTDFVNVQDNLRIKIINRFKNKELLKGCPYRAFLDLAVVAYCDASQFCGFSASVLIKNEHLSIWGKEADEVLDIAINNTKKLPKLVRDITDFPGICHLSTGVDKGLMYVVSNQDLYYGAAEIMFEDTLLELIRDENKGIYIIPSSIHEIIVILCNDEVDTEELNSLICQVNKQSLPKEDFLADHAYYYSKNEGYLYV